jgi:outer membrane protein assembly factor BamB
VRAAACILLLTLAPAPAPAEDWSQWRGPARDGASGALARVRWPETLRPGWRVAVGEGQSSPVVSRGTVFVFGREGEEEVARALDLKTGATRWRRGYAAPYKVYPGAASYGRGPRSTPVVDAGRLFTLGISGILSAFDVESGRLVWQKDFAGRFPASAPPFGTSMSPLVAGGLLVVHAGGHEGGALIAFDPATGAEKWVLAGAGPSYSSPVVASVGGSAQVIAQVHREVVGVDLASGRRLWSLPFVTPCDQNIVTPLVAGDLLVLSSLDQGTMAYRLGGSGTPERVWHTREVSMYMSSPVLVDGRLVGLSHRKRGQVFAIEAATGAVQWLSAGAQAENAALVVLGDSLLMLLGDGRLLVLPRGASGFAPVRTYQVAQTATYAHPVPTPLGLLIRDEGGLGLHAVS